MTRKTHMAIVCDECKHEFSLDAVNIESPDVEAKGKLLSLTFFTCPKCNKIYRVLLADARYFKLKEDFEKAKQRIRRNRGSNSETARVFYSAALKKFERLKAHVGSLNRTFPGTFTFVVSENNHEEKKTIKYLP